MSIKTVENDPDGLKRNFMLTIPATDIEARVDEEVKRIAPQVRMPGFRPGKVPPNLVRKMHGDSLRQDALQGSVQAGVEELLMKTGIRPAVRPEVNLATDYTPGGDAEVNVSVEALPIVAPPQVDDIKIDRLNVEVSEDDLNEQLARLASQGKRWTDAPKKHAAALGDQIIMDFDGKVGGNPFNGGAGTDMAIELGSGRLIPGFEDQLVGAKVGEDRNVTVTFPDNYPVEELKGKRFAFGDPNSTMGHLMPRYMLAQAGVRAEQLASFKHISDHMNIVLAVLAGDFDAGAVKEDVFFTQEQRGLRAIATSPPIFDHLFISSKRLPAEKVGALRNALLNLAKEPNGKAILQAMTPGVTGLVSAANQDYDNLRSILNKLKELGVNP